jgi:hypothetical protein
MRKSHRFFDTIFHQFGTKQTCINLITFLTQFSYNFPSIGVSSCRNLIDFLTQFFINSGQNKLMQKFHQLFDRIFHQFGTKQTSRNVINFLTQFSHTFPLIRLASR